MNTLQNNPLYEVMQVNPGIYDIRGDRFTTRIIESKSLDVADILWVKNLRDNVEANQAEQVITQYNYIKNKAHLASFLYEKMNCNLRDVAPERGFFSNKNFFDVFRYCKIIPYWL